jgi:hypothetical protein
MRTLWQLIQYESSSFHKHFHRGTFRLGLGLVVPIKPVSEWKNASTSKGASLYNIT